ncbi:MAG: hypothetical protein IJT96_00630 [Lachnospiraceae bacterium]|nr:hypothetical protein [Lachnospiraceae bacterium]
MPRTRQGASTALKKLGYSSTGSMLVDNLALSLTDCYWIKPRTADITWHDVNLFENHFVDYFGEITINSNADVGRRARFSRLRQKTMPTVWAASATSSRIMKPSSSPHGRSCRTAACATMTWISRWLKT